jgi:general secretion pathway protein C
MIIANMQMTISKPWMPRLAAFLLALLLAATVVFWIMRWPSAEIGPALPLAQVRDELPAANSTLMARLLGQADVTEEAKAAPSAASRFLLTGIIASGRGRGVALVSIDGKPPKPYREGSQIEEGWMLQSVEPRSIALATDAKAPVGLRLELPVRQP